VGFDLPQGAKTGAYQTVGYHVSAAQGPCFGHAWVEDGMSEKLCVFCTNMEICDDRGFGSTETGPYGSKGPSCKKGHFNHYSTECIDDMDEYRELIIKAETCSDYDQVKP